MNVTKSAIIFVGGVCLGSAVGWFVAKRKFNKILEEMNAEPDISEEINPPKEEPKSIEPVTVNVAKAVAGYRGSYPEVVTPEEFDEADDEYERESLTYYDEDGVLINAYGQDITASMEETIGVEFKDDVVDDVVYVRNDRLQTVYEVLIEHGKSGLSGDDAEGSNG